MARDKSDRVSLLASGEGLAAAPLTPKKKKKSGTGSKKSSSSKSLNGSPSPKLSKADATFVNMPTTPRGSGPHSPAPAATTTQRFAKSICCCRLTRGTACFRFSLLFLSALVVLSGYFSFDMPSITSEELKRLLKIENEQLGALFSVYAFPNAVSE